MNFQPLYLMDLSILPILLFLPILLSLSLARSFYLSLVIVYQLSLVVHLLFLGIVWHLFHAYVLWLCAYYFMNLMPIAMFCCVWFENSMNSIQTEKSVSKTYAHHRIWITSLSVFQCFSFLFRWICTHVFVLQPQPFNVLIPLDSWHVFGGWCSCLQRFIEYIQKWVWYKWKWKLWTKWQTKRQRERKNGKSIIYIEHHPIDYHLIIQLWFLSHCLHKRLTFFFSRQ